MIHSLRDTEAAASQPFHEDHPIAGIGGFCNWATSMLPGGFGAVLAGYFEESNAEAMQR
jgi:hypothetical protein